MTDYFGLLKKKIENKTAIIAVLGLGYVGLPLALAFIEKDFIVIGIDTDEKKIKKLKKAKTYLDDVSNLQIKNALTKKFQPSNNFENLKKADVIIVCVPTPLTFDRSPDLSHLLSATEEIKKFFQRGQLIIYESTTYPGTCREVILPLLEQGKYRVNRDFFLAFAPERIDPGNKKFTLYNTPKIVGGKEAKSTELACLFYCQIIAEVRPVSSTAVAEMTKILENSFRAVNIAFINEMAIICQQLGLNIWEVIEAAATKPFGFMKFLPGPGIGGHCIPIDPLYLSWKMKTKNYSTRFIDLAHEINSRMPEYVLGRLNEFFNENGMTLFGAKFYLLGIAYKPNISDTRESPALEIIKLLLNKKVRICYFDPYVPKIEVEGIKFFSEKKLKKEKISQADCVLIITPHSQINWSKIVEWSQLIFDTRNATAGLKSSKIVRL